MSLSSKQTLALLRELELVDTFKTGFVLAHHVDPCLARAGILTTAEQNAALLLFSVDASSGKAGYARLYPAPSPTAAAARSAPQQVYQKLPELRESFNRFDLGVISLDQFRRELTSKLQLEETESVKELFRHHAFDVTFNALVQALNREDSSTSSKPEPSSSSVALASLPQQHGVFAGNRVDDLSAAANLQAKSVRVLGHKPSQTFAEERDHHRRGPGTAASPVAAAAAAAPGDESGTLRSQVVLAVRRLDEGGLNSTRVFLGVLQELGLPVTPTLQRLLEMHRLGNPIPFKDWMRAFEPLLTSQQQRQREQQLLHESQAFSAKAPTPASLQKGFFPLSTASTAAASPSQVNGRLFGEGLAGPDHPTKRTYEDKSFRSTDRLLEASSPRPDLVLGPSAMLRSSQQPPTPASRQDFLCWSEEDQKRPPKAEAVPIRSAGGSTTFGSQSIFDRSPTRAVNVVRKTGTPQSRTPFGTEADYAASFANYHPTTFG